MLMMTPVAPFTGAWIEIRAESLARNELIVAPFTGAWIEIPSFSGHALPSLSLPSRERGLKLAAGWRAAGLRWVAPFTGAWIEIFHHQALRG